MEQHFTVVVEVKQTIEPHPVTDDKGYTSKGLGGVMVLTERRVIDRLRLVVSAADEEDAVSRAIRMLVTHQDSVRSQVPTAGDPHPV